MVAQGRQELVRPGWRGLDESGGSRGSLEGVGGHKTIPFTVMHMATRVADLVSEALKQGGPVDEATLREINTLQPGDVSPEAEKVMLKALSDTTDPRLRNVLAMTLASINSGEAGNRIAALINQNETRGYRGALLYALNKLHRPLPLVTLVSLILADTPEVQEEAFEMLRDSGGRSSHPDLEAAILLLHNAPRGNEPERQEIIADTHDLLCSLIRKEGGSDRERSGTRN